MAQSQEMTATGLQELAILLATTGSTAASPIARIVCMETTGTTGCTASSTSTYASPIFSFSTTGYGLDEAAIASVGTTGGNGVITYDHVFTCTSTGGAKTVSGIHVVNNDGDVSFIECCFASVVSMENTDTLTIDGSLTLSGSTT